MMSNAMLLFVLGFVWLLGLTVQTIVMSRRKKMYLETIVVVFLVSITWVILVRKLVFSSSVEDIISYSAGTALGAIIGKILTEKYEDRFHH